ncbi:MAG TPA: sialate O-acetylesterase [Actinoplanes sp.]
MSAAAQPGFDIVAVLGQSNASGTNDDYEPHGRDAYDDRIQVFPASGPASRTIQPAVEPLASLLGRGDGLGPGGPFATELLAHLPAERQVLIVPCGVGGTGFNAHGSFPGRWKVSDRTPGVLNLFEFSLVHLRRAIAAADSVGTTRAAAVLWHQGEADGSPGRRTADHAADLDELIDALRARLPLFARTPFLVGQLAAERLADQPGASEVDAAHRGTPKRRPHTGFAAGPGPGYCLRDRTHLSAEGQRLLARSYFTEWLRLRDEDPEQ